MITSSKNLLFRIRLLHKIIVRHLDEQLMDKLRQARGDTGQVESATVKKLRRAGQSAFSKLRYRVPLRGIQIYLKKLSLSDFHGQFPRFCHPL
jgi:hypothetical protein